MSNGAYVKRSEIVSDTSVYTVTGTLQNIPVDAEYRGNLKDTLNAACTLDKNPFAANVEIHETRTVVRKLVWKYL